MEAVEPLPDGSPGGSGLPAAAAAGRWPELTAAVPTAGLRGRGGSPCGRPGRMRLWPPLSEGERALIEEGLGETRAWLEPGDPRAVGFTMIGCIGDRATSDDVVVGWWSSESDSEREGGGRSWDHNCETRLSPPGWVGKGPAPRSLPTEAQSGTKTRRFSSIENTH